jgi:hypothetical protein
VRFAGELPRKERRDRNKKLLACLQFRLEIGGQENLKWFVQLSRELGRPIKALENMPKLIPYLAEYMEAFDLLSASRSITFGGVGPIPLSEILCYMSWSGVEGLTEQKRLIRILQALDGEYLRLSNKGSKK